MTKYLTLETNTEGKLVVAGLVSNGKLTTLRDMMTDSSSLDKLLPVLPNATYLDYRATAGNLTVDSVGVAIDDSEDMPSMGTAFEDLVSFQENADEANYNAYMNIFVNDLGFTKEQMHKAMSDYLVYNRSLADNTLRIMQSNQIPFSDAHMTISEINQRSTSPEISTVPVGYQDLPQDSPEDILDFRLPSAVDLYNEYLVKPYLNQIEELGESFGDESKGGSDRGEAVAELIASFPPEISTLLMTRIEIEEPNFDDISDPYFGKNMLRYVEWNKKIVDTYRGTDPAIVKGYSDMNELPIQENELPIYTAMVKLIRESIQIESTNEGKPLTDTHIDEKIEEGYLPKSLRAFFKSIIVSAVIHTRVHTGKIMTTVQTKEGSEEMIPGLAVVDDKGNEVVSSMYTRLMKYKPEDTGVVDEEVENFRNDAYRFKEKIFNFIYLADNTLAYPEAVIKLLRWGNRKPRMLYLENRKDKETKVYFDLETFKVLDFDGDFSKLTPLVVDGADKEITAVVVSNKTMQSSNVQILRQYGFGKTYENMDTFQAILGFELTRRYEKTEQVLVQYVDIKSLAEMVKQQKDGSRVKGVDFLEGKFYFSDEVYRNLGYIVEGTGSGRTIQRTGRTSIITLEDAVVNTIKDSEKYKNQPTRETMKFVTELDLDLNSVNLNQQVSAIPLWSTMLNTLDLNEMFDLQQINDLYDLKMFSIEKGISLEQTVVRKTAGEFIDSLLKGQAVFDSLTDNGIKAVHDVPLEVALTEMQHIFEETKTTNTTATDSSTSQPYGMDLDIDGFKAEMQGLMSSKEPAFRFLIGNTVLGFVTNVSPKTLYSAREHSESEYTIVGDLGPQDFINIYSRFANQDATLLNEYVYEVSYNSLAIMAQDYQAIASQA